MACEECKNMRLRLAEWMEMARISGNKAESYKLLFEKEREEHVKTLKSMNEKLNILIKDMGDLIK